MKKAALFILSVITFVTLVAANALAWDKVKLYAEAEAAASFVKMDSGGTNTSGPHENTGDDKTVRAVPSLHIGAKFFDVVRGDIAFHYRGKGDFTTNSYRPPVPTYFYQTEVKDVYSLMFSVYAEPWTFKGFTPYVGAGLGSTWMKISTNDTEVAGEASETKFTWQVEAGLQYAFTDHLSVRIGYRYVDMGKFVVPLSDVTPSGELTGKMTAHEVMAAFRYTF